MAIKENKMLHSLAVGRLMEQMAEGRGWNPERTKEMFLLGMLHDIGYEHGEPKSHAVIGGELLKKSNYRYWQEVYHHGSPDTEYDSEELDLLNMADLSIDSCGFYVTPYERVKEIKRRYGADSDEYKNATLIKEKYFNG